MYKSLNDAAGLCRSLAPGTTRIWYVKPNHFADAMLGALVVDPQRLHETHILLGKVSGDDSSENNLEILFRDLQGENWSPNGEAHNLILSKGLNHTSMSTGDVIETADGVFICAMFGWLKIGVPDKTTLLRIVDVRSGMMARRGYYVFGRLVWTTARPIARHERRGFTFCYSTYKDLFQFPRRWFARVPT